MDYKYIELERQIKSLMNKNFVVSSTRSKSAEEVSNGSCQLYIDTIQKYFIFKVSGLTESICINPLTNSLLNVKYINGVDVSNLCSGISAGYGINIENLNDGVFKINVKENMFALKNEVDEVNDKFDKYYTKTECNDEFVNGDSFDEYKTLVSDTYSTKTELTTSLTNHYTKTECDEKYNPISEFNTYKTFVTNNYATKTDVEGSLLDYYTKTESDGKYALKSEIGSGGNVEVDLSNYYTKSQCDDKYAYRQFYYVKEEIDEMLLDVKDDCKNKFVMKPGEYPIAFRKISYDNGCNYLIRASYGDMIHIKASYYNHKSYEITTELVILDSEANFGLILFGEELQLGVFPFENGYLRLFNSQEYTITELNLIVEDESVNSNGEKYESVPFHVYRIDSPSVYFKIQSDNITQEDTLRFKGYYQKPQNTFTYEAVMKLSEIARRRPQPRGAGGHPPPQRRALFCGFPGRPLAAVPLCGAHRLLPVGGDAGAVRRLRPCFRPLPAATPGLPRGHPL